jgi:formate hydrogenlyase subunit 6/NADH:ubiquinone oxidoreductase subunit I
MVQGQLFAADCTSCARCLNVCPQDFIRYGLGFQKTKGREQTLLTKETMHEGADCY